jgi:hypothetical protein
LITRVPRERRPWDIGMTRGLPEGCAISVAIATEGAQDRQGPGQRTQTLRRLENAGFVDRAI